MKQKKILIFLLVLLVVFNFQSFASVKRPVNAVFMGEIKGVEYNEKDNNLRITVKGYVKGCEMYREELVAVITEETLILPKECPKEGEEPKFEKANPKKFTVKKGEVVFIVLGDAMTKSVPPQIAVKAIQVSK